MTLVQWTSFFEFNIFGVLINRKKDSFSVMTSFHISSPANFSPGSNAPIEFPIYKKVDQMTTTFDHRIGDRILRTSKEFRKVYSWILILTSRGVPLSLIFQMRCSLRSPISYLRKRS